MDVTIYREPCWLLEAAELVYGLVNRIPPERMTASGPYCIPAEAVMRIQQEACAGISPEDETLRFYFKGVKLKGSAERLSCLGCTLLYSSLEVDHPDPDDMVKAISTSWHEMRAAGYRVDEINVFTLGMHVGDSGKFKSLAKELMDLPLPKAYRMQLLEVFSSFDEHLYRVAELLKPIAQKLPALMEPWVSQTESLVTQWESFFRENSARDFFLQRAQTEFEEYRSLEIAFRYFSPTPSPGKLRESDGSLRCLIGVSLKPSLSRTGSEETMEEWELNALRLMGSAPRMEILRMVTDTYMTTQEIAQRLGINYGSVFRDVNSMYNAALLQVQTIGGRNYYRTNKSAVSQIADRLKHHLKCEE
ncbi:MAG: winged helix-turn-helix domain-containing protein [Faecousia sp.]